LLLSRLAPREDAQYRHIEDNSASHLQASMMGFSQMVYIENGKLVLGRWQGLYLCEFDGPRERTVIVKLQAD
jgi:secondary thiamine-phosphate synthase enzyme